MHSKLRFHYDEHAHYDVTADGLKYLASVNKCKVTSALQLRRREAPQSVMGFYEPTQESAKSRVLSNRLPVSLRPNKVARLSQRTGGLRVSKASP